MPIGPTAMWGAVLPVAKVNQGLNPSFERGTSGVAAIQAATIGSAADFQQFGAWSAAVTPGANGTSGGAFGTWTAGNGTDYTVSAYVRGVDSVAYMIGVGDSSGLNLSGSTAFTGGGTWHRHAFSYSEAAGAVRRVVIRKTSGANAGTFYVDGVQIEVGSLTTYIDGDQEGCTWLGAVHASQSQRDGQSRAGGSVVALADLGFTPNEAVGIGMPPLETTAQSYAMVDGGEFQRQRAAARTFTLTAQMDGTSQGDYHTVRRTVINALKIDAVTPQQPVRFWYVGAGGTVQIDAVMEGGLEGGVQSGFSEVAGVSFTAYNDPYWKNTTQEGTALAPRVSLGSVNFIAKRSPLGAWGTLGVAGTTFTSATSWGVAALAFNSGGTLFLGGDFGSAGGTAAGRIALYHPTLNQFGTLIGGTVEGGAARVVRALSFRPDNVLFLGGLFNTVAGTQARNVAKWDGAFGTLTGGTINSSVYALAYAPTGTLFLGGVFTTAAGTAAPQAAQWDGANFGTLTNGSVSSDVNALIYAPWGSLYLGGAFVTAGGTANTNGLASWNGTFGTLAGGVQNTLNVYALALSPGALLYAGGNFGTASGGTTSPHITAWNGVTNTRLGLGVQVGATSAGYVGELLALPNGNLIVSGSFNQTGARILPDHVAQWNGAVFVPLDIDLPPSALVTQEVIALARGLDDTIYIGGDFFGTGYAAAVGTVVNKGMGVTYPVLRVRSTAASGTARLFQFSNNTTKDNLYFDLSLLPSEEVVLKLTPGQRSFQSSFRGNVFGQILGGSNIATWRLMPGTNYVSFFADSDSLAVDLFWHPRSTADQGRIN